MNTLTRYGTLAALAAGLSFNSWLEGWSLGVFLVMAWILSHGQFLYLMYHTLGRDLRAAKFMLHLLTLVKKSEWQNLTVPKMFSQTVKRFPDKIMFYFEDETWTFQQVEDYSNSVANFFLGLGYSKGDSLALFMENRPEYVATWLGLAKIGVVPALINYNLKDEALTHTVQVANCKGLIYGVELAQEVFKIHSNLVNGSILYPTFSSGPPSQRDVNIPSTIDLNDHLNACSKAPVPQKIQDSFGFKDKLLFIYTSGTTGLPKAAVIKHSRYILASGGCTTVIGCRPDDVLYVTLPLYHSVGGMIALAGVMKHGITMVMRKKFSAKIYWADCVKYRVTAAVYIGEICRYLLNTKECPEEKQHHVRLMFGNGLRPDIWPKFTQRFNIPNIAEFYGSTEGNSNIINYENRVGAVGFVSVLFPNLLPLGLIKVDQVTGVEVRDPDGLCIRCLPNEPGEFVGQIVKNHPVRDFDGYADQASTRKKILHNVWKQGDMCFRSGDILTMDEFGWLYFKDRSGDTFRWRGENVSTTEVESTVRSMVNLKDTVVYGVEVPGMEGKAGMVSLHDPQEEIDLGQLAEGIKKKLPTFSWPLFVRLVKHLDITGTFKLRKFNLQKEGFDPSVISDKLFFLHPKTGTYEILNVELFNSIITGAIRL
jgi:solute carrier family 27 fatty acid transporter 1/4